MKQVIAIRLLFSPVLFSCCRWWLFIRAAVVFELAFVPWNPPPAVPILLPDPNMEDMVPDNVVVPLIRLFVVALILSELWLERVVMPEGGEMCERDTRVEEDTLKQRGQFVTSSNRKKSDRLKKLRIYSSSTPTPFLCSAYELQSPLFFCVN